MRRLTVLGSVAGLLWCNGTRAQPPAREDPSLALAHIESAFRSGDAKELRAVVGPSSRVRVDLRSGRATLGSYAPGQFESVFARFFAEHTTTAFAFGPEAVRVYGDAAFARAAWVRRPRDQPQAVTQMLTFTLWRENGAWHLVEIRSSP